MSTNEATLLGLQSPQKPWDLQNAQENFENLIIWVRLHKFIVDIESFMRACDTVARKAAKECDLRISYGILGRGLITFDYAASLLNTHIPTDLISSKLPGATAFDLAQKL